MAQLLDLPDHVLSHILTLLADAQSLGRVRAASRALAACILDECWQVPSKAASWLVRRRQDGDALESLDTIETVAVEKTY